MLINGLICQINKKNITFWTSLLILCFFPPWQAIWQLVILPLVLLLYPIIWLFHSLLPVKTPRANPLSSTCIANVFNPSSLEVLVIFPHSTGVSALHACSFCPIELLFVLMFLYFQISATDTALHLLATWGQRNIIIIINFHRKSELTQQTRV